MKSRVYWIISLALSFYFFKSSQVSFRGTTSRFAVEPEKADYGLGVFFICLAVGGLGAVIYFGWRDFHELDD